MVGPVPPDPDWPRAHTSVEASDLAGRRILIVEDEFFLALYLEDALRAAGCAIVGPFGNLPSATRAARSEPFDFAILDINLNGDAVYPLVDELLARRIPLVFLTGYGRSALPQEYRTIPRLSKPCDPVLLIQEVRRALRPK